jgi:hypothetical protein
MNNDILTTDERTFNSVDAELEITRLREALSIANLTIGQVRTETSGHPEYAGWLQRKVLAQAKALTRLNERVCNQRFVLRNIERLGRGLTLEERIQAERLENRTIEQAQ